jgi:hypothetical protein
MKHRAIRRETAVNLYKLANIPIMTNMDDAVTKGFLKEALAAFEERLAGRFANIDEKFEAIDARFANLEARMELGFSELNERLDAEQVFTSDMWDDFSSRLAVLEAK